jgi:DNA-directed RNA polymerase specialized sigma24 family protein
VEDVDVEEFVEKLVEETSLAKREAEAYVYTEILDYSAEKAAEKMSTSEYNVYQKRFRFKDKIEEARKTLQHTVEEEYR